MNSNSTPWTWSVFFAFIARFVGLRSHNAAFSPPLSKFRISEGGFRKSGISTLLFFCLALMISQIGLTQTTTLPYSPNFSVPGRGLVRPETGIGNCFGVDNNHDPANCATYNVSGMNWTLTGTTTDPFFMYYNLATTPERSYAQTIAGNKFETARTGGDICVTSPVINIASAGNVTINLAVLRNGTGLYNDPGDDVELKYILDGNLVTSGNMSGAAGTTSSLSWTVSGNSLQVFACMSQNQLIETYQVTTFKVSNAQTCSQVATATENMTWTGAASSDWHNPCNWSPNGVPTSTNAVFINSGTDAVVVSANAVVKSILIRGNRKLTINSGVTLNIVGDGTATAYFDIFPNSTVDNYGTVALETTTGGSVGGYLSIHDTDTRENNTSFTNFGTLKINSTNSLAAELSNGLGVSTLTNYSCGKILITNGEFRVRSYQFGDNSNHIVNNYGLFQTGGSIVNLSTFRNYGVLKYNAYSSPNHGIDFDGAGSVKVNNDPTNTTIFTYYGTFTGTVNGIFTNAAATTSAGTFTAPNTFVPSSGLPSGSQTLYAEITPSGGACSYVVPFTYNYVCNITLTAGAVTNTTTCGGANGSIAFTSTNLPNGEYDLSFTATGAGATASPQKVTVTSNAFNLAGLKAGTYSNFSLTNLTTGCTGTVATSKTVNNPATPTLVVGTRTNPTTCGGTEGVIPFTSNNLPDGMYDLSFTATGAGATTSPQRVSVASNAFTLSGLKAGTYSNFSITRNNCMGTSTASRALADPAAPTLTAGAATNTTTCGGTNGRIAFTTANLPNGTYELTYTEAGVTARVSKNVSVSSNVFNLLGLKAGTYSNFSITNPNTGCTGTDATSKPVADPLTPTIVAGTAVNPTTCGGVGSIPFTSTNLADGRYSLDFTATTGATTSPQDVMVSGNAFTLSGLTVGTYSNFSLTRTGCTATDAASKNIANPATPTLAAGVKVNPTTCGGTDGSIPFTTSLPNGMHQLTYTGVGSPKMVSVTSGTFTLSGLAAGSYSNFSITNNGCTRTITAVRSLTDPNPPVLTLGTSTNPTACNLADGSIAFTATNMGGIAGSYPLSYDKDGIASSKNVNVNASGAFTLTGLADGVYSGFSITNPSGCTGSLETEVTLSDLALPVLTVGTATNPTTCSGTEGGISFTSTNLPNGTYPLSFSTTGTISPKDVVVTNNTFTLMGLSKGTYSNFSVNRSGCIGSVATSKTLSDPATPTLTVGVATNPTTCAGADGEIDFTSTNLPNNTYQLSFTATGTGATTSPQTVAVTNNAFTLGGLKAGTYSAFSITRNNCTGSVATSKMLSDPPSPTITAGTPINPTTCSAADGSIPFTSTNLPDDDYTLTYTGAGSPKIVSVLNNAFSLTGLDNGTYSNFSLSNNGCTASHNISKTVANPTAPTLTAGLATNPTTCASTDGKIAFTTTLADGSYTLTYTGAGSSKMINVASGAFELTGLADGTYSNFRIAHSGCTSIASTSKTLSDPVPPTITAGTPTNTTTCGGDEGTIPFTTSLPDGQYNINYTGGNGSQMVMVTNGAFTLIGLESGVYSGFSVTVGGCTGIDNTSKTVSDPLAPTLSSPFQLSISNCGGSGRLDFNATNLSPTTTSLSVSFTATGANATPSPQTVSVTYFPSSGTYIFPLSLKAGTYSNFSITHNGCTATSFGTETFTDPTPPTISVTSQTNVLCNGSATGGFTFSVTGGSGSITAVVRDANNNPVATTGSNPYTVSGLAAGTYSINVSRHDCSASQNVELTQPATPLSMSTTKTDVTVNGGNDGTITVTASGGTGALQFSKDGGTNYTAGTSPYTFNNLTAATYQLRVKDANACETAVATETIGQPTPTVRLNCPSSTTTTACQTQSAVNNAFSLWLLTASATGGCDGVLSNNNVAQGGAPPACGGSRTVTFTYTSSCAPTTTTCQATFTVPAAPTVVLTCPTNTTTTACQTQAAVDAAFATWLATASGTGGCNGTLTNNSVSLGGAPPACGGSRIVTFIYTSTCGTSTTTCQATFTVPAAPTVTLTCPTNTTTTACQTQAAVDAAFATWLATASGTGGCNGTLTNNSISLGGAPSACGGSRTVTFTYTSACAPTTTTCQATFTVPAAPTVSLTCPTNQTEAFGQTQAAINAKFATWLATASGSGGCNGALSNNNTGAPPATGGSATVTFTYTSSCAPLTTTCQASFTVSNTPPVVLTCPTSKTASSRCLTQAQLTAEYNAWLATASGSGGCGGVLTNNSPGAPSICSATAISQTVTFTYTSECAPLITTCQATFTVPAYPDFNAPANSGAIRVCLAQTEQPIPPVVRDACGNLITPSAPTVVDRPNPLTCEGTRTYTYNYTDCAGHSHDWTFTWTLDVPTLSVDVPGTATVSCPSAPPPTYPNTITDACGRPLTVTGPTVTSSPDPVTCEGTKTYTWNLMDCAGNTNTWSWIITIKRKDFTVPTNGAATVSSMSAATAPTLPTVKSSCDEILTPTGPVIVNNPNPLVCGGTVTYTYTYTDCTGNTHPWSFIYTVSPTIPTVSITGLNVDYCKNATAVTLTGTPTGGTFKIDGNAATQFDPSVLSVGNHTVMYSYTDGNGCSNSATQSVAVNALPVLSITGATTICIGSTTTLSPTTGGTWVSSSDALATVTNAGVVTGVGNGTPSFTFTQTSTGCSRTTSAILVNPTPSVSATNKTQTICSGGTIATMIVSASPNTTVYNWTRDKTSEVTGIAASGSGNISGTLTNTTNAPVTVTFTITPKFTNFGVTCTGTPITATVLVNPLPTISCVGNLLDNSDVGVCGKNISYNSTVTGTAPITITYKFEGATTGAGSGIGSGSFFNVGVTTVTLTATNSCGTATCSFTVTISGTPTLTLGTIPAICAGAMSFTIPYTGTATTYSISGTGITTVTDAALPNSPITVNLSAPASGTSIPFTLAVKNVSGCTSSMTGSVTVHPSLIVSTPSAGSIYLQGSSTTLSVTASGGTPPYQYSLNNGTFQNSNSFYITAGSYRVTVKDMNGCTATSSALYVPDGTAPITCPPTARIEFNQLTANGSALPDVTGFLKTFIQVDNVSFTDQKYDVNCGTITGGNLDFNPTLLADAIQVLRRTFIAKNTGSIISYSCSQQIYVGAPKLADVVFPTDKILPCADSRIEPTDTSINHYTILGTGFPTVFNQVLSEGLVKNLTQTYTDQRITNPNGFTIKRTWVVKNVCTGETRTFVQNLTYRSDAGTCPTALSTISGKIRREDLMDIPAKISVFNAANDLLNNATNSTYSFNNLLVNNGYRVTAERPNTDWTNGVTTFDVALISRHVLGIAPLATPYQIIAADANRNGEVDAADLLHFQRLILRLDNQLPNNNSWRFVPKNYVFGDPTNPFASDFPEVLNVPNLTNAVTNGDFVAIKVGDVNNSLGAANIRGGTESFKLSVEDKVLEKNQSYEIPVRTAATATAIQYALTIDKTLAQIEAISKGDLPNSSDNNFGFFKNENTVTAAWTRSPNQKFEADEMFTMVNLVIKPTKTVRLSEILTINPVYTEGVAYDEAGKGAPVKLSFGNQKSSSEKAVLLPNRPNPFSNETTISFILPEASLAKLTVCDVLGKVVMVSEKQFAKGLNEVVFNAQSTPSVASGVFVVRLQTVTGVAEQKIVLQQ